MAKEYIERGALIKRLGVTPILKYGIPTYTRDGVIDLVEKQPAADVVEVPQEYAYYTDFDDENYLVHLTIPISEKQFKALGQGADLWETLRMDGE